MDKEYWENYYKHHSKDKGISRHSSFSEFCLNTYFHDNKLNIVEIGSGNGRDAIYFANYGHKVHAIDQSKVDIDLERNKISDDVRKNLVPVSEDFISIKFDYAKPINVFYSRFTLHAITKQDQDILLPKIYNSLAKDGLLCIEVRTTNDPFFGVGKDCGDNTFLTDHKRRFIDSQVFLKQMLSLGFVLLYFTEEDNLSVYKGDNPVLMRIILKK
jgi:SAM-dependent methyltransferase